MDGASWQRKISPRGFCQEGFPRCSVGTHISARAQEHILRQACEVDARVALLEVMFVLITVHLGPQLAVPDVASVSVQLPPPPVRSVEITGATWEFLDQVTHSRFEAVSSFSPWKIEVLFFRGFARTPSCAVGKGSCGRESGLEAFRSGAHHAFAQTKTHRKCGSGRVVPQSRRVRQRQVGRFVERCPGPCSP